MPRHKHADSMALYAKDAMETETPWKRWQTRRIEERDWRDCWQHHAWSTEWEYRRKPRTIRIGSFDVPEPMREAPERGSEYFVISLTAKEMRHSSRWDDDNVDAGRLERGICHSTREAAELHAKALISLTEKKP